MVVPQGMSYAAIAGESSAPCFYPDIPGFTLLTPSLPLGPLLQLTPPTHNR